MVIHPVLLFCAHADTDRGNVPGPDVLAERLGADAEQGGGCNEDQRPVLTGEESVDEQADRHRKSQLQHTGEHRAGEIQGEEFAVGLVVGEETLEELPRSDLVPGHGLHLKHRAQEVSF